ncbi:hypothetical protein HHI36_000514 [Cryptolaemus montrouzieri]
MHQASIKHLTHSKLVSQLKQYLAKVPQSELLQSALSKEIAHILQRIEPSIYGSDLIRYFTHSSAMIEDNKIQKKEPKEQNTGLSLPNILDTLKIKISSNEAPKPKEVSPKWLIKPVISKEAISSRTTYLLSSIATSTNEENRLAKVDEFCDHVKQYADAKHMAVRGGGISSLLKIRNVEKSSKVKGALNEALILLGYTEPVTGAGVRILSIDGGGTRGVLVIEMLKKLEELAGKPILEMFDLICGVSTGAIIASLIVIQRKSLDEIETIYKNIGTRVFTQHPIKGTSSLVWSHSYYDTPLWEELLKAEVGEELLISSQRNPKTPKLMTVSAVVNQSRLSAYVFRNYNLPCKVQSQYIGGSNHQVWEAVRASAAAPTYFEEFKLGNTLHQDGGILVNNPTAVAIHEAKLLWPRTPLQCVISCGTGRTAPNPIDSSAESVSASSWKSKFLAVIDSATDTEGVHSMLSDLLPPKTYYRFNPYLTEMLGIAEISPEKMLQLKKDAIMYLRRNEEKFQEAANTLKIQKSVMQKLNDYINYQLEMQGIVASKY